MTSERSFTFIEILIVIGLITFLTSTAVVMINPAKRIEEARDKQREVHLEVILRAVEERNTVEKGWPEDEYTGCKSLPQETTVDENGKELPVFKIIGTKDDPNYYDLYACLVPKYLDNPLFDPVEGSEEDTKYQIWQNPYTKKVTLRYVGEDNKVITVGPTVYTIVKEPTVSTYDIDTEKVYYDRATIEGGVTDDGGSFIFERGFAWCPGECEPTLTDNYTVVGSGIGDFSYQVLNLEADKRYSFRAWAKNDVGLAWGETKQFLTDTGRPIVETEDATHYGGNWAYLCGNIVSPGAENPERWIDWGDTEDMPYSIYFDVGSEGVYCDYVRNLTINTTYYFQAGASNSIGTSKGDVKTFSTEVGEPMVTNTAVDSESITYHSVIISGNVEENGGANLSKVGACYSISGPPDPEVDSCTWQSKTALGSFSITLDGLDPGVFYYVRACAKNTAGFTGCDVRYKTFTTYKAPQSAPSSVTLDDLIYGQDGYVEWESVDTAEAYDLELYVNDSLISDASTTIQSPATSSYISSQYYQAGDSVYVKVRAAESDTHYASDFTLSSTKTVAKADQDIPSWINLDDLSYGQDGYVEWASVDTAENYDVDVYINGSLHTTGEFTDHTTQVTTTSYDIPAEWYDVGDSVHVEVRAAESTNYNAGSYKISEEKIVGKGSQSVEITGVSWTSETGTVEATVIAEQAKEGAQYYGVRLEEGDDWTWQTSNIFSGLAPVTNYEFQSKVDETEHYLPATSSVYSCSSHSCTSPKAYQEIDNIAGVDFAPQICHVDATIQPVNGANDYRVKLTDDEEWGEWQTSNEFTGLEGNTSYDFQARKEETSIYFEALSNIYADTTPKANQPSPGEINVSSIGYDRATVDGGTGTNVSLDETNWYNSSYTFTGLYCGTEYSAYAYYPETDTHNASDTASTTFTTKDISDYPSPSRAGQPITCDPPLASDRQTYTVSTSDNPQITKIIVDPLDVYNGDQQYVFVRVNETAGKAITSVSGEAKTNTMSFPFDLSLLCGTETDGWWYGSWTNGEEYCQNYVLTITAASDSGTSRVDLTFR